MTHAKKHKYTTQTSEEQDDRILLFTKGWKGLVNNEHYSDYMPQPEYWNLGVASLADVVRVNVHSAFPSPSIYFRGFYLHTPSPFYQIGNSCYYIPGELTAVREAIENSKHLTAVSSDWDEANSSEIPQELWDTACQFLLNYAMRIFYSDKCIIDAPEINPVPNGTLDLSWRTTRARMLVNIRKEKGEFNAYFYGDQYNNIRPIKGSVPTTEIANYLAQWMKENLLV